MKNLIKAFLLLPLVIISMNESDAQQRTRWEYWDEPVKYAYVHANVGGSISWFDSPSLERSTDNDLKIKNVGLVRAYGLRGGIGNYAQFEWRERSGTHTLTNVNTDAGTNGGSVTTGNISTKMRMQSRDLLFKINPFFWTMEAEDQWSSFVFLLGGPAKVQYLDDQDQGWIGNGANWGIEFGKMTRIFGYAFGVTYQDLNFDQIGSADGIAPIPDIDASNLLLHFSLTVGLGY